jgi:sugar phosphate permease
VSGNGRLSLFRRLDTLILRRLAPRIFYGWLIAVGCGLVSFVVVGIGFYGVVVFLDALVTEHGWNRVEISAATSLYWIVTGVAGVALGRAVDRVGARSFLAVGVLVMSLALAWIGRLSEPWQVFPAYVLLGIGFTLAGNIPTGAILARWFVVYRSRAMMISHTGVSIGGMLLVPLATGWVGDSGLQVAADRLALLLLAIALPIILFVLRFDPREYGLEPDGGATGRRRNLALSDEHQHRIWRRRDILRSRAFHRLAAAYALMLFSQVAFAMHELTFMRDRIGPELAAIAVSITAASSFLARIVVGSLADRVSKRRLASLLFVVQAAMLTLAAVADEPLGLLGAAAGFGATVGSIFMLQQLIVGELFGLASFGTALSLQQFVTQIASGLGPLALGALAAFYGYPMALMWLVACALAGAGIVLTVQPDASPHLEADSG